MSQQYPFLATIVEQYTSQGKTSELVSEIYEQLITNENQTVGYFLNEMEQKPINS
jgi:hypothetical protein